MAVAANLHQHGERGALLRLRRLEAVDECVAERLLVEASRRRGLVLPAFRRRERWLGRGERILESVGAEGRADESQRGGRQGGGPWRAATKP